MIEACFGSISSHKSYNRWFILPLSKLVSKLGGSSRHCRGKITDKCLLDRPFHFSPVSLAWLIISRHSFVSLNSPRHLKKSIKTSQQISLTKLSCTAIETSFAHSSYRFSSARFCILSSSRFSLFEEGTAGLYWTFCIFIVTADCCCSWFKHAWHTINYQLKRLGFALQLGNAGQCNAGYACFHVFGRHPSL